MKVVKLLKKCWTALRKEMVYFQNDLTDVTQFRFTTIHGDNMTPTSTLNLTADLCLGIPSAARLLACWREPHTHRERAQNTKHHHVFANAQRWSINITWSAEAEGLGLVAFACRGFSCTTLRMSPLCCLCVGGAMYLCKWMGGGVFVVNIAQGEGCQ